MFVMLLHGRPDHVQFLWGIVLSLGSLTCAFAGVHSPLNRRFVVFALVQWIAFWLDVLMSRLGGGPIFSYLLLACVLTGNLAVLQWYFSNRNKLVEESPENDEAVQRLFRSEIDVVETGGEKLRMPSDIPEKLMSVLPAMVYLKGLDSRYLLANRLFLEWTGSGTIGGKMDHDFFSEESARQNHEEDRELMDSGIPRLNIGRILRTVHGREFRFLMNKAPFRDGSGEIAGLIGVGLDVTAAKGMEERLEGLLQDMEWGNWELSQVNDQLTREIAERRRIEAELREAGEAALTAVRAKGEFLANMSHEIRTPMNGVIGMTDLLLDTPLNTEQKEFAETIQRSAGALMQIINDILDFSKIEAGKLDIEIIDFDLRTTVEDVCDMFALKIQEKGLEFVCIQNPATPSFLRGDPGRLRQILVNLIGNAVKFTAQGEIVLRVDPDEEDDSGCRVMFSVADTGIGIPSGRTRELFQSFSQVDASTTRKYGGTGLGLAISKQLCRIMGGDIEVESEEGRGSIFRFSVFFEKQTGAPVRELVVPMDIRNRRILIVDDNATNRFVLHETLRSWHCRCSEAVDGPEALELLHDAVKNDDPFHIAVLDMQMPGMDGETLGRLIKATPALKDTLLVMLSSWAKRGDAVRLQEIGFAAFLRKPVKRSQLFDCLITVNGMSNIEPETRASVFITRHTIAESRKKRTRVLLAEDNPTNQRMAVLILGKMGYQADVAENGREVLAALSSKHYDLVLMDVQMPEMDGFEATAAIRQKEQRDGTHLPIIALTAHAMQGDRARCLDAGMDDYVTKPIQPADLTQAIERVLAESLKQRDGNDRLVGLDRSGSFNMEVLLKRLSGDEDLVREILDVFLGDVPSQLFELEQALETGDASAIRQCAHRLKGASASVAADILHGLSYEIELAAKDDKLDNAKKSYEKLLSEFESFKQAVGR